MSRSATLLNERSWQWL